MECRRCFRQNELVQTTQYILLCLWRLYSKKYRKSISDFVQKVYFVYFNLKIERRWQTLDPKQYLQNVYWTLKTMDKRKWRSIQVWWSYDLAGTEKSQLLFLLITEQKDQFQFSICLKTCPSFRIRTRSKFSGPFCSLDRVFRTFKVEQVELVNLRQHRQNLYFLLKLLQVTLLDRYFDLSKERLELLASRFKD